MREGGERLWLVPAQAAAEDTAAAPQPDRHEIVVGRGEPRPGETHQHAAVLDPAREPVVRIAGDVADVGEDEHRQVLVEKMRHRFRRRLALREPHIGERAERAPDVVARGQQRLRRIGGRAGDDADGAAAPALVEELDRAGRALAGNLDARNIVANFDRQIEPRLGLAVRCLERERRLAEREALEIERAHGAALRRVRSRTQHLYAERAGGVVDGGEGASAG